MSKKPPPPPKRSQGPKRREASPKRWRPSFAAATVVVVAAAGIVAAFAATRGGSKSVAVRDPVRSGPAPAFSERNVVTDQPVTSDGLRGRKVLLFFTEGVMCQACFEQIKALEQHVFHLERRRLTLVTITPDPPDVLRQAADAYSLQTPLISDEDRDMSEAYATLGVQGAMHSDRPGHTFLLVDGQGQIRWRRDYRTMYVPPNDLLAAVPRV